MPVPAPTAGRYPLSMSADPDDTPDPVMTDLEARFPTGGPDVLRIAYEAHGAVVFTFCRRSLDPDGAADATQEVFTAAWRSRSRFDPAKGSLRGWLIGIARYKVLGHLRRRPPTPVEPTDIDADVDGATDGGLDQLADRMVVAQALQELPERVRKNVLLTYVDGLTHRQIAERTGEPLGTVKSDIRRALVRLRRDLGAIDG